MTRRILFAAAAILILWMPILPACGQPVSSSSATYEELYRSGLPYETFLDQAERRRQRWMNNTAIAGVPPELLERADAAGGPFYLLAVAVDGCSDSVNTIPYLAALVKQSENLEMRIVDAVAGEGVMMSHRTPDGRPATPTVLVLDAQFKEVGVFIERPAELQEWALGTKDSLALDAYLEQKFAWYDEDLGRSTVEEVVALMESFRVPRWMTGTFEDDYGIRYDIGPSTWITGAGGDSQAVHHVTEWNADERYAIARNGAQNEYAPGRWTRIDWMSLENVEDMDPYTWAFCLTVYEAPDAAAARMADSADRSSPRTGCEGHPFSRMKPLDGQQTDH